MRPIQLASLLTLAALVLGACGGAGLATRKTIEGNNTGGSIPPALLAGNDPQALADKHCARWNTRARITFSGAEAGGDVVFVCETEHGPAMLARPQAAPEGTAGQPPAKR